MSAGRDIVVSMRPSSRPRTQSRIGGTNDNTHLNRFGSWNVKERFMLGGGIFKTEEGQTFVKRTVNVVIEKNGTAKDCPSDPDSRSHLNDKEAAHHMEVAYGMKVHVSGATKVGGKPQEVFPALIRYII
jgi:hypothetical protein